MAIISNDFIIGDNGDKTIKDGDWFTGLSDNQNVKAILLAYSGNFRNAPTLGANVRSNINSSEDKRDLFRKISNELRKDKYKVKELTFSGEFDTQVFNIKADRTQ